MKRIWGGGCQKENREKEVRWRRRMVKIYRRPYRRRMGNTIWRKNMSKSIWRKRKSFGGEDVNKKIYM